MSRRYRRAVAFLLMRTSSQSFSGTYGLLTNDSLSAAVMESLALTDLASNDPDFSIVPALTIWQPQP